MIDGSTDGSILIQNIELTIERKQGEGIKNGGGNYGDLESEFAAVGMLEGLGHRDVAPLDRQSGNQGKGVL